MRYCLLAIFTLAIVACASTTNAPHSSADSATTVAVASGSNPIGPFDNSSGCMEGPLAQFGRYIGKWNIEDSQFAQDGSGWSDGPGARWDFECLGNGTAIQDFWMPNGRPVGTNLRTYRPETASWDIAWAVKGQPGFSHITAKQNETGNIVMSYVSPIPDPPRRITFYPPGDDTWNWTLEMSFDGGTNWTEVYRIKATRINQVIGGDGRMEPESLEIELDGAPRFNVLRPCLTGSFGAEARFDDTSGACSDGKWRVL